MLYKDEAINLLQRKHHMVNKFKGKDREILIKLDKHYKCKFVSDINRFIIGERNEKII